VDGKWKPQRQEGEEKYLSNKIAQYRYEKLIISKKSRELKLTIKRKSNLGRCNIGDVGGG